MLERNTNYLFSISPAVHSNELLINSWMSKGSLKPSMKKLIPKNKRKEKVNPNILVIELSICNRRLTILQEFKLHFYTLK